MLKLVYNPMTRVYRITENGMIKEGKFSLSQVFQILRNYVIRMNGAS